MLPRQAPRANVLAETRPLDAAANQSPGPPGRRRAHRSLQWEGEQTYIPLYADGTASGLGYEHDRDRQVTPPVRIGER